MASGVRLAVVGATGAVGRTTLKLLGERRFPVRAQLRNPAALNGIQIAELLIGSSTA